MRLHSYIIYSDSGFAPNPDWGYCTLATCKPGIRRQAKLNDWIMATGTENNVGRTRLVYAMHVEEILMYDEYYRDKRFEKKIVSKPDAPPECRGDNMYYLEKDGRWRRAPMSFRHAAIRNVRKDLAGRHVLIAKNEFWYFGRDAVLLPEEFESLIYLGEGDTSALHEGEIVGQLISWIEGEFAPGKHGEPWECITRDSYGITPVEIPADLDLQSVKFK